MPHRWVVGILCVLLGIFTGISSGVIDKFLTSVAKGVAKVKTCGKPHIQNIMTNVTAKPGQMATFKCQVDMSCIVAYIEWYHEMDNGTEKLIKTASSSGDPHVHIIKQVKPTDEGLYTCIAGNVLGQATASAYLEVNRGVLGPISNQSLLFLLLILVFAQNQVWIDRLTSFRLPMIRHQAVESWIIQKTADSATRKKQCDQIQNKPDSFLLFFAANKLCQIPIVLQEKTTSFVCENKLN